MQTIIELNDRDNVIVTDTRHRDSVDTDTCARDYARLMCNHMREDAVDAILLAIIEVTNPDPTLTDEDMDSLVEMAYFAIRDLA